jgi:arylsulfatase A-like enzyme
MRAARVPWCFALIVALAATGGVPREANGAERPNVVLVMTDDQGYGDLGCHGNPVLNTPSLDRLYQQSIRLANFHVDPTCSPTRAALLTGKYSCRTGVWHTIMGRSLLRRDEVTMADLFARAGYRTGIFGKWHLGDNYPYRAVDRGFQVSLVHGGGGITQTPDYWGNSYFSPTLYHNGKPVRTKGYCTDVFFAEALRFIEANRDRPFFLYIPTNVPHSPYQVAESYSKPYRDAGLPETLANFYGMIANLDENLGRLIEKLDDLKLAEDTILVFLTDNGTAGQGFNTRMRGRKGSEYDGGHRVPCFVRWPARLAGGRDIGRLTAHIDILPTLADLCDIPLSEDLKLDGMSLTPLLLSRGEAWPDRTLFVQSHRIEHPQPWRQSAVMSDRYRLVNGEELYDMEDDPQQVSTIAAEHHGIVKIMRREYEDWYEYVSERFDEYCPIVLGSPEQNPATLTCHDWHGPAVPWNQGHILRRLEANGFWAVEVARAGRYEITLRERPGWVKYPIRAGIARLKIGDQESLKQIPPGTTGVTFQVNLQAGKTRLQTWLAEKFGAVRGAYFVDVTYVGPQ